MKRVERLEALTFDEALATQVICGTPDSFTARLKEVQEEIGLDGILAELNCGGKIPHDGVDARAPAPLRGSEAAGFTDTIVQLSSRVPWQQRMEGQRGA